MQQKPTEPSLTGWFCCFMPLVRLRLPHKFIQANDSRLKELAFFLLCKYRHGNSRVYNYNVSSLARKLGCSRGRVRSMVSKMLSYNWCKIDESGNLIFRKYSKILRYKHRVSIDAEYSLEGILNKLRLYLLTNKKQQCDFAIKVRGNLLNPNDLESYRSARRNSKKLNLKGAPDKDFKLSNIGASKIFNCSAGHAGRIIRSLRDAKLLNIFPYREVLMKCSWQVAKFCAIKNTFWSYGHLYRVHANILQLIPLTMEQNG